MLTIRVFKNILLNGFACHPSIYGEIVGFLGINIGGIAVCSWVVLNDVDTIQTIGASEKVKRMIMIIVLVIFSASDCFFTPRICNCL
jgi:hypothetical protein